MPKRQATSPRSSEHQGKYARRASPMQVDVKSASPAKGVAERSSRPYAHKSKPKTKSPTYYTAKSESRTYFSVPVSRPAPAPKQSQQVPASKPPPAPKQSKPASRPPPAPARTNLSFPQMLRNYYHAQFLKLKQQFGSQPFELSMRILVPFYPDKVYANTSMDISKHAGLNAIVNTFYQDLEKKRNTTVTFENLWMIYRTYAIKLV